MESVVAYTEEIDDLKFAVEEISEQLKDFRFLKNSMAIVFAEEETDYPEFYRVLSEKFSVPVIGCTVMASLLEPGGFKGIGISVMFLTADDCEFSIGFSSGIKTENYEGKMETLYRDTVSKLSEKPKLMLTFGSIVNDERDVDADYVLKKLDEISDHIPICGALSSDGFSFTNYRIFCNEQSIQNGQVIALISGNIVPKALSVATLTSKSDFSYVVTEARRNHVYKVGDETFIEAMRKGDLLKDYDGTGRQMVLGDYILSPFVVTVKYPNGDTIEFVRNLSFLNYDNCSGSFLGTIPEGAVISICILNRDDVQKSVKDLFQKLVEIIRNEPDRYKTVLCCTCCARFLALGSDVEGEAKAFRGMLPPGVSLIGIYSYGEFCPVQGSKTNTQYNMFHNFTFSLLVF